MPSNMVLARSAIAARRCDSDRAAPADCSSASIKGARSSHALMAVREQPRYRFAVRRQRGQGGDRVQQCGGLVAGQDARAEAGSPTASAHRYPADGRGWTRARPRPRRRFPLRPRHRVRATRPVRRSAIASAFCVRSDRHLATSAGVDGAYRRLAAKPSMASFSLPARHSAPAAPQSVDARRRAAARWCPRAPLSNSDCRSDRQRSRGRHWPSAIRWPARLPLSTEETYFGSSARRSLVSYQL